MAKSDNSNFEMPSEMKEFAEKSVAQAKQAFDTFIAATHHAVGTAETHAKTVQSGVKEASDLAIKFAERNVQASFDFAQRLMQAKDAKEVTSLQMDYLKSQIAAFSEQAQELSKKVTKTNG